MNPLRTKLIRQAILTSLKHAEGYPVLEESLRPHVDGLIRPPVKDDEWAGAIKFLLDGLMIVSVPVEFDPSLVQWAITEKGRTLLATL